MAQPQERQPNCAGFYHYEPFEMGGPCGLCSRYLSLDRRVLWLIELTDLWKWMQGPELHRRSMLMRRAGALALPAFENRSWSACVDTAYPA